MVNANSECVLRDWSVSSSVVSLRSVFGGSCCQCAADGARSDSAEWVGAELGREARR